MDRLAERLRTYLVTDDRTDGKSLVDVVEAAMQGGVTCVQLRRKGALGREFVTLARELRKRTELRGVLFIINDRVDIALLTGADGVHVGQEDIHVRDARLLLGDKIIGVSADTVNEALSAQNDGADYLGIGAVYPTHTKSDAGFTGLGGLASVCKAVTIPVVGIGGITIANAAPVISHGAVGVAVVSALMSAQNPTAAAQDLTTAIRFAPGADKCLVLAQNGNEASVNEPGM